MTHPPTWPLLALALALSACGDIGALFGRTQAAPAPSQSASCDAAVRAMGQPQPIAVAGRELPPPATRAEAFATCMQAAGWHSVAATPTPAAPAMHIARPGTQAGASRRALGLEVAPTALSFRAPGYDRGAPGLLVLQVLPGGAAQTGGLRRGDILLGFAGRPVAAPEAMQTALSAIPPGSRVAVELWRDQMPMVATLAF